MKSTDIIKEYKKFIEETGFKDNPINWHIFKRAFRKGCCYNEKDNISKL